MCRAQRRDLRPWLGSTVGRMLGNMSSRYLRGFALVTASVVSLAGGSTATTLASPSESPADAVASPYVPPAPEDFSALTASDAFAELHRKMEAEYAFTQWKDIDWDALRDRYAPLIARAEAGGDEQAYYLTLRRYLHEFRDGHVSMKPENQAVTEALAGGGFGMTVMRIDSGSIVVDWVQPGGAAWRAGIRAKARILRWRNQRVDRALRRTSTALSPNMPTDGRVEYEKLRFLVRAPIGAQRTVTFRNPGDRRSRQRALTAADDDLLTLERTSMASVINSGWPERMIDHRMLAGGVGYIRAYAEIDLPAELPGDHTPTLTLFRRAIRDLKTKGASGLIIDVRANSGGSDQMVADFMSSFFPKRSLYEYQNYLVPGTGRFEIWRVDDTTGEYRWPGRGLWIQPDGPRFTGPVVGLVNNGCISSGEGVAMGIKRLPQGRIVGFTETNGSFGMAGDAALMPGGYEIHWPFGQSLAKDRVVQIDAHYGRGGVHPDVRVPMTADTAHRTATGQDLVLKAGVRELRSMLARVGLS